MGVQDSNLFAPYVQHQLVTALLDGAYDSNDADLALSLATVRSQMAHELYGPGVQHAAALGELVNAQLFKCEKPSAIKQVFTAHLLAPGLFHPGPENVPRNPALCVVFW